MIRSMTGFAAVAADLPGVALAVELRSVNHRFLDLQLRLPDELRGLEATLRERILAELKRQGFAGNLSIEYETKWDNSVPDVAQCVGYFRGYGACQ